MARTPQDVTERELAVLQALWDAGPATIRRLTDVLYPGGGAVQGVFGGAGEGSAELPFVERKQVTDRRKRARRRVGILAGK